jgi:hypothetical protein
MYNLTGIYWIKNETRYIPEWIEFHLLQGFDHFIFYDNGSTDGLYEVMEPYIEKNLVEIRNYPDPLYPPAKSGPDGSKNFWLMDYCIDEQKGKSKWIHFHAQDEFTYMLDGSSLVDFLKNFEDIGGLSVDQILFPHNGHIERPTGLQIENYVNGFVDPIYRIKTFIMPDKTIGTNGNAHNFALINGRTGVNEHRRPTNDSFNAEPATFSKIKNHHYFTRSKQEFDEKMEKGVLDRQDWENIKRPSADYDWNFSISYPTSPHENLLPFVPIIKKLISERYVGREHLLELINH